ncbi:MAG: single-stranded-DNA-specific exonuclease RecJ, partial [Methylotenera sp.]
AFESVVKSLITETDLQAVMETDGGLQSHEVSLQTAQLLAKQVWGQGFQQPLFFDAFQVINQRIVGEKHLKLILEKDQKRFDAIYFNQRDFLPDQISAAYVLEANEYKGLQTVQLQLKYAA